MIKGASWKERVVQMKGKQVQLHLSETTCQQMHLLCSCKPGLLLVTIAAHEDYTLIKQCFSTRVQD